MLLPNFLDYSHLLCILNCSRDFSRKKVMVDLSLPTFEHQIYIQASITNPVLCASVDLAVGKCGGSEQVSDWNIHYM